MALISVCIDRRHRNGPVKIKFRKTSKLGHSRLADLSSAAVIREYCLATAVSYGIIIRQRQRRMNNFQWLSPGRKIVNINKVRKTSASVPVVCPCYLTIVRTQTKSISNHNDKWSSQKCYRFSISMCVRSIPSYTHIFHILPTHTVCPLGCMESIHSRNSYTIAVRNNKLQNALQ